MATLSQNITQAISDFNAIKGAIRRKGANVPDGTPTSDYSDCIDRIPVSSAYADSLKAMVERSANAHVYIPDGTTSVGINAFGGFTNLTAVTFPDSLTTLNAQAFQTTGLTSVDLNKVTYSGGQVFLNCNRLTSIDFGDNYRTFGGTGVFQNCSALTQVTLPDGFTSSGQSTFQNCQSLATVNLPATLWSIGSYCFYGCSSLVTINIPGSVTQVANNSFTSCSSLTNVTIGTGFNANNLNLSASTLYTADTIVSWLNALADRTGQTAYTLTIGAANIAKLTAEEIAIATNKNWNLA